MTGEIKKFNPNTRIEACSLMFKIVFVGFRITVEYKCKERR